MNMEFGGGDKIVELIVGLFEKRQTHISKRLIKECEDNYGDILDLPGGIYADGCVFAYDDDDIVDERHPAFRCINNFESDKAQLIKDNGQNGTNNMRLRLKEFDYDAYHGCLTIRFGAIRYLEWQLLYMHMLGKDAEYGTGKFQKNGALNRYLRENGSGFEDVMAKLLEQRTFPRDISSCLWSCCGCGVWVVTKDNYLTYTERTDPTLGTFKDAYGYSTCGGCTYYEKDENNHDTEIRNNPISQAKVFLKRKLAIDEKDYDAIKLRCVGVDKSRALIQFSFFVQTNKTKKECEADYNKARSKGELRNAGVHVCYCKFNEKNVKRILEGNINTILKIRKMEPAGLISLIRCWNDYKEN